MTRQRRFLLLSSMLSTVAGLVIQPAAAAPWVRGFVVGSYEYAFRYGGRAGFERTGEIEPGSDCAHGSTLHFSNDNQLRMALKPQRWRSQDQIAKIAQPPGLE